MSDDVLLKSDGWLHYGIMQAFECQGDYEGVKLNRNNQCHLYSFQ